MLKPANGIQPAFSGDLVIGSYGDICLLRVSVQGGYNGSLIALLLGVNHFTDCCALTTIVPNCRVPRSYTAVMGTSTCFI